MSRNKTKQKINVITESGDPGVIDTGLTKRTSHVVLALVAGAGLGAVVADYLNLDLIKKMGSGSLTKEEEASLRKQLEAALATSSENAEMVEDLRKQIDAVGADDGVSQEDVDRVQSLLKEANSKLISVKAELDACKAEKEAKTERVRQLEIQLTSSGDELSELVSTWNQFAEANSDSTAEALDANAGKEIILSKIVEAISTFRFRSVSEASDPRDVDLNEEFKKLFTSMETHNIINSDDKAVLIKAYSEGTHENIDPVRNVINHIAAQAQPLEPVIGRVIDAWNSNDSISRGHKVARSSISTMMLHNLELAIGRVDLS